MAHRGGVLRDARRRRGNLERDKHHLGSEPRKLDHGPGRDGRRVRDLRRRRGRQLHEEQVRPIQLRVSARRAGRERRRRRADVPAAREPDACGGRAVSPCAEYYGADEHQLGGPDGRGQW